LLDDSAIDGDFGCGAEEIANFGSDGLNVMANGVTAGGDEFFGRVEGL
jgi:hypothetical protein